MVLAGIEKYFTTVKTNTVVIKNINDDEVLDIVNKVSTLKSEIRFIEYMDVGESNNWNFSKIIPSQQLYELISSKYEL